MHRLKTPMRKFLQFILGVTALAFASIDASLAATGIFSLPDSQIVPTLFDLEGHIHASQQVNVLYYGADSNGVNESRGAFIAALAAVPSGGVLYVPRGTYLFNSQWSITKSNVKIIGDGAAMKAPRESLTPFVSA